LNDEEFGFDIMSVQEIIRPPRTARLPRTPDSMDGVANLRGSLLPIVDLRVRFGMQRAQATDRTRVLVIEIDGVRTGLLVDGVRQVVRVAQSEFEPPPVAIRSRGTDYIDGIVKLDEGARIIIALDARRVCAYADPAATTISSKVDSLHTAPSSTAETQHRERSKGVSMRQLVSFKVGREEFAFKMVDVREILRVQAPKEVPGAPKHLLGVLTVRGQILPIVDLRRLLALGSLAEDHIESCRKAGAGYQNILDLTATGAQSATWASAAAVAGEGLRQWLSAFNSSSQTMMETLAKVKRMNEQVGRTVASVLRQSGGAATAEAKAEVLEVARNILSSLRTFAQQVAANIAEDQRIMVVDSNGFHLGLVVDHVNEVLSVQEEDIEAPPPAAQHGGVNLYGVAKLNGGDRLILLLETGSLLDSHHLEALAREQGTAAAQPGEHAAARQVERVAMEEDLQVVTFLLGEEEYGIPIAKIQEIDRLSKVTQTPKAPKFVEGVANLRGEVIPVLSTRSLFALEPKKPDDRKRVIIVDLAGAKTGMVVDSVKEVMSIASRNIAPPPASIANGTDNHFISGIGKVGDGKRMIVLLDVGRVLTSGEQSALAAVSHSG
jgi:chemotaxis signal transduction protein